MIYIYSLLLLYLVNTINSLPSSVSPPWAHRHWVWLVASDANQDSLTELVQGYLDRDINVGAVNCDSGWSTAYNNFEIDEEKYPDFKGFVDGMHNQYINVLLWVTSMVDTDDPDYAYAAAHDYLIKDSRGHTRPLKWWHGNGGLIDYSNPEAKDWWHSKMDNVLDMGVDGFKTDGTDPYIIEYMIGGGAYNYKGEQVTYRDYAAWYYRDFFYYPKEHSNWTKNETLIMSRPIDCTTSKGDMLCLSFSPKDVVLSGWVGDDDSSWNGLRSCMRKLIFSAYDGYALYGCDIGGYRNHGKSKEIFIRWAQLGSVISLMENGGGGTHQPWLYDEETLNIYAKYVDLHYQLIPYMMTVGTDAFNNGVSAMVPLIPRPADEPNRYPDPKSVSYSLGDSIYIHPIVDNYTDIHEITFPDSNDDTDEICSYINFWDSKEIYECNSKILKKYELAQYPIFLKTGSMLPFYSNQYEEKLKIVMVNPFGCSISKLGYSDDRILLDGNGCSNNMKMYEWQDEGVEGSYNIISSNGIPKDNKDEFSLYLDLSVIEMDMNISSYDKKQVQVEIRDEYLALKAKLNFVSFYNTNDLKNPLDMDLTNIDSGIILIDNLDASNGLNIVAYVMELNKE